MRTVTVEDLLNISLEDYQALGYFDQCTVLRVWDEHGRIQQLPDNLGKTLYKGVKVYSPEGFALFDNWLKEQKASFYSDEHCSFSPYKAIEQALKDGNTLVYVEDLS